MYPNADTDYIMLLYKKLTMMMMLMMAAMAATTMSLAVEAKKGIGLLRTW